MTIFTYDMITNEEVTSQTYNVNSDGVMRVGLPVPTQESVDSWNNKLNFWKLGNNTVNNTNNQVSFSDGEIVISSNNTITFPYIKHVEFDGNNIEVINNSITLNSTYTKLFTPTDSGIVLEETARADGGTDYTVMHESYITTEGLLKDYDDIQNYTGDLVMIDNITVTNGHVVGFSKTSVGLQALFDRINALERRIEAFENIIDAESSGTEF